MPPSSSITVGIAVETTVASSAAMAIARISPTTVTARWVRRAEDLGMPGARYRGAPPPPATALVPGGWARAPQLALHRHVRGPPRAAPALAREERPPRLPHPRLRDRRRRAAHPRQERVSPL